MTEAHHVFGVVTGTGAAIAVGSEKCGFAPKQVKVVRVTGANAPVSLLWQVPQSDAAGIKTVAAGTGSVISTGGITPAVAGFSIGTDADLNVSGATLLYEAVG